MGVAGCVVTFGVFFAVIAGFIPPPGESWSAAHVAEFYANNRTAIRAGLIGAMFGWRCCCHSSRSCRRR